MSGEIGGLSQRPQAAESPSVQSRTTTARVRDNTSRVKPGKLFFITLSLNKESFYEGIREDFVNSFEGVVTFCCAIEQSGKSELVSRHLHCFLEFEEALLLADLRSFIVALFEDCKLDIQACRSKRNVLKYISKEDRLVYFNCKESLLHFNYRAYVWAKNTPVFRFADLFVMEHRNQYRYLMKYHAEVRKDLINKFEGLKPMTDTYFGWALECSMWWNDIIQKSIVKKRLKLFLYGLSNVGKSSFIEKMIGLDNLKYIYYPGVGKFFMQDFDETFHRIIVFEEFDISNYCLSMLKRLLEGRPYAYSVKCESDKVIAFNGPIIFVSNDDVCDDEAFKNRLLIVNAETKYWTQGTCQIPKVEPVDVQEISSEEELSD